MTATMLVVIASLILGVALAADEEIKANCLVEASTGDTAHPIVGNVMFTQPIQGNTIINVSLSGFVTTDEYTLHGFHIHELGELGDACKDAGGHYNPNNMNHGAPTASVRHVGDLGNIEEDAQGEVEVDIIDSQVKLSGATSVMGRAVVIHLMADDLGLGTGDAMAGSLSTGNAGARIACCKILDANMAGGASVTSYSLALTLLTVLLAIIC